jgi:TetR/AcrR family transcriptional regulator
LRSTPSSSRLFANEILQGASRIKSILKGPLRALVDNNFLVIKDWIEDGVLRTVHPTRLIFMIWAITQRFAYFEVQIDALSNASREDRFKIAAQTLRTVFMEGLLPRG